MRLLSVLPFLALAALSRALDVGDPAPPLTVKIYVKGQAVELSKGIHVIDFWTSRSPDAEADATKMTDLAHKYKDKVDVTGVSIVEGKEDPLGHVKKFVAKLGPKMDYNVAWDGDENTAAKAWVAGVQVEHIPVAFLVKDGRILWYGAPTEGLDKAIDDTVAGTFDIAAEKAKRDAAKAKAEADRAAMEKLMQPFVDAMQATDFNGALDELDAVEAKRPDLKPKLVATRFMVLMRVQGPKMLAFAQHVTANEYKDDPDVLNEFAWSIVDPDAQLERPNYQAALVMAQRAAEVSGMKNGAILDTYALSLYKTGDRTKAVEMQTKAVELAKADKEIDPKTLKAMSDRLTEFKKAPATP